VYEVDGRRDAVLLHSEEESDYEMEEAHKEDCSQYSCVLPSLLTSAPSSQTSSVCIFLLMSESKL
jgi:hypothetical protein